MMFGLDAVNVVRSVYLAGVAAGIFLCSVPFLKENVVNYGSRAQPAAARDVKKGGHPPDRRVSDKRTIPSWLSTVAAGVPHSWFVHYYILSVFMSLFWLWNCAAKGTAFLAVSRFVDTSDGATSMAISQVRIVWLLMLIQGARRLIESTVFMKNSASRMPWSIYGIGLVYYLNMSVAVWIEESILDEPLLQLGLPLPSVRTTVGLVVFTLASGLQHDCHAYLASLQKYTLPTHPAFQQLVCPHYTAECVLYLALAFMAAPAGHIFNWTLMSNVLFVVVNLGLVADETKRWSETKFGREKVMGRARMIPLIW